MVDTGIVVLVIVVLLILVIAASIVIIRLLFYTNATTVTPDTSPAPIGYDCTNRTCQDGMSCDPETRQCKLVDGESCDDRYDCLTSSYCNIVCIPRSSSNGARSGLVGDNCPCDYRTQSCVNGICLSLTVCTVDSDCASGICTNGTCSSLLINGRTCIEDYQCASGNCSLGICQNNNVVTGRIGSYCNDDYQCNDVLMCVPTDDDRGTCRLP